MKNKIIDKTCPDWYKVASNVLKPLEGKQLEWVGIMDANCKQEFHFNELNAHAKGVKGVGKYILTTNGLVSLRTITTLLLQNYYLKGRNGYSPAPRAYKYKTVKKEYVDKWEEILGGPGCPLIVTRVDFDSSERILMTFKNQNLILSIKSYRPYSDKPDFQWSLRTLDSDMSVNTFK